MDKNSTMSTFISINGGGRASQSQEYKWQLSWVFGQKVKPPRGRLGDRLVLYANVHGKTDTCRKHRSM